LHAGAEAIGPSRLANAALRRLVVPELIASARADVAEAEANHATAEAGSTKEGSAIAGAQVEAAAAALAVSSGKGQQKVTVHSGGQAIVGTVERPMPANSSKSENRNDAYPMHLSLVF
jgi:hypothetical protein